MINYNQQNKNQNYKRGKNGIRNQESSRNFLALNAYSQPAQKKVLISVREINKIEKNYRADSDDEISTFEAKKFQIFLSYPDIYTFQYIFGNLMEIEQRAEIKASKRNQIKNIKFVLFEHRNSGSFKGGDYGCKFTEREELDITSSKFPE